MIVSPLQRARQRLDALDPLAPHPLLGAGAGLALVVALVPLLSYARGSSGPLGPSIPLFFLVPVLLSSAMGGLRMGALVSVVAIVVWDWYFIPPLYTFTVYYPRDLLALVVFFAVALSVGNLAAAVRRRAAEALRRAQSAEALHDLSLALIARTDLADVLSSLTARLRATLDLDACAVLLPDDGRSTWLTAAQAGPIPLDLSVEQSRTAVSTAGWVNEAGQAAWLGQMAGAGLRNGHLVRPHVRQTRAQFLPLRVDARGLGVLELVYKDGVVPDGDGARLVATFANGAALALEQVRLAAEEHAAAVARESDRLKSALLASVSHDLRTPLTTIKGAASSLLQEDVHWSDEARRAFLVDIDAEADRLTRLVSNLLDLSRIEGGAIVPRAEWEDVGDLVDRVVRRLEPRLSVHPLVYERPMGLLAARLDAVQIEQALTNLIENAAKYASPGTPIMVAARLIDGAADAPSVHLSVSDQGPGIPLSEQASIFAAFYRVAGAARLADGTGLGLTIATGLVVAHGGRVTVASAPGRGSTFTIILPVRRDGELRLRDEAPLDDPVEEGALR
jgi:two-component system sensor histidine kinase KdpD